MKLLLYCTKAKPYLQVNRCVLPTEFDRYILSKEQYYSAFGEPLDRLNGKIVAECDFEVEEIGLVEIPDYAGDECHTFVYDVSIYFETKTLNQDKLFKKSCLNWEEMERYLYSTNGKGYAIHIKNLHIFDKPKELSEFYKIIKVDEADFNENDYKYVSIEKAPQNMMYAYDNEGNKYIVISIQSQWFCLILNRIKDVEVRKQVLKEMLG